MIVKLIKFIAGIVLLLGAIVVAGTVVPRPVWPSGTAVRGDALRHILVLSNPIHTDIAVPVSADIVARFGFLRHAGLDIDNQNVRYLVFGWGGRAFYTETPTWADLKAMPVARSLTLDRSVMHVSLAGDIPLDHPAVTLINVSGEGFERLLHFVDSSFSRNADGPVLVAGAGYGDNDAFFEAEGFFNAFAGCNTWTAAGLRQAGLTSGWWAGLPWMLRLSLWLHNAPEVFSPPGPAP